MKSTVRVIVGLGNPGRDYEDTRHNAGFWFVDRLCQNFHGNWSNETRFQAQVARISIQGEELWLLKPNTYMNASGRAVSLFMQFYRLATSSLLVAHDELDLEPGDVKFKYAGGSAGHNGLKDISSALSSPDYWRLRLGIGHPGERHRVADYVLTRPSRSDEELIGEAIERVLLIVPEFVFGNRDQAVKTLHSRGD